MITNSIEIPKFLSHLKTYGGYPVPFVQMWLDGKPDFRVIDPEKSTRCVRQKLCAVCGVRLGEFCYFIGGDLCKANHLFTDPAMHGQCAEFATQACAFLSGRKCVTDDIDKFQRGPRLFVRYCAEIRNRKGDLRRFFHEEDCEWNAQLFS
jgi:hypothetical protein